MAKGIKFVEGAKTPYPRFVRRVPTHLVEFFGRAVWKDALKTRDQIEMKLAAVEHERRTNRLIEIAERAIADGFPTLAEWEAAQATAAFMRPATDEQVAGALVAHVRAELAVATSALLADPVRDPEDALSRVGELHRPIVNGTAIRSRAGLFAADLESAQGNPFALAPFWTSKEIRAALVKQGIGLPPDDPRVRRHWRAFATVSMRLIAELEDMIRDPFRSHAHGEAVLAEAANAFGIITTAAAPLPAPIPPALRPSASKAAKGKVSDLIYSKVWERRAKEERSVGNWREKTDREHQAYRDLFLSVLPDRPLPEYTKADVREFKSVLMRLPPNWSKLVPLRNLTPTKAAEKAEKLGLKPMSASNVNKVLSYVGSTWTWAEPLFDEVENNPFRRMGISTGTKARDERHPFTPAELALVFNSTIYRGAKSARQWRLRGDFIDRDSARWWVPLVGLHSGMRLGEIIQLGHSDVRTESGVTFFDIRPDAEEKRVKTRAGIRRIPVHSGLVALGFLDFLKRAKRNGSTRIFADVPRGEDGYWSTVFSKWFSGHFLSVAGVTRPKVVFHSFRHTFEDAMRDADLSPSLMDAMQGHSESGERGRYGSGHKLTTLADAMAKVTIPVDLSHLVPSKLVAP
ncbi:site-specific integrase [uncultured Aureimonas sp.]|uniref:site-specific integrase n=1 Tax=uncultured Aureimonas sp. TaxID=1604662 RepID=UPI0025ED51A4|nr:site-specific integrase [uncultured Aureimonas sp.]